MEEKTPLTIADLLTMQKALQEKYFEKWGGLSPAQGARQMLWLYGELSEAADLIKKKGDAAILADEAVRTHFIEEMCDALMYFNDVLLCFDITPEELEPIYKEKFERNMSRW